MSYFKKFARAERELEKSRRKVESLESQLEDSQSEVLILQDALGGINKTIFGGATDRSKLIAIQTVLTEALK